MSENKIITATLNPSLDRTMVIRYLSLGYHNHTEEATRLDAAGKGVSIARALQNLDVSVHAVILLGDDATGLAYESLIASASYGVTIVRRQGLTRNETILYEAGKNEETRIMEEASAVTQADLDHFMDALLPLVNEGDTAVLAGVLPAGAPSETYAWMARLLHEKGAKVALISCGNVLDDVMEAAPDLLTLKQLELEGYFNYPIRELEDVIASGIKLQAKGATRVLIEDRTKGKGILIGRERVWKIVLPEAGDGTSTGMWEGLVAGYLAGRLKEEPMQDALELGALAAAYAATHYGHDFGEPQDLTQLDMDVDVEQIQETNDEDSA